jgi:hypothetical protein
MADTKDLKAAVQHDFDRLVEARDELRVQLNLAKAEVSDEWDKLETTWLKVQDEFKRVGDHTKAPVKDIGVATQQLIDELKQGYDRIRAQIKT